MASVAKRSKRRASKAHKSAPSQSEVMARIQAARDSMIVGMTSLVMMLIREIELDREKSAR